MHLLIIQTGNRSKTILTTPLIRSCRTEKKASLTVIVRDQNTALLEENPYIDQVLSFSAFRKNKNFRDVQFDAVIDLSDTLKTKLLRRSIKGPKLVFSKRNVFSEWLYIKLKLGTLNKRHLSDRYLDVVSPIGIFGDESGIDFFIPEADEVENNWLPETHRGGYAVVAVAAEESTQKLPVNRIIELCDRINKPIVLIGERDDENTCAEVEAFFRQGTVAQELEIETLNKKTIIFNACGKFNFNQRASLIRESRWVFAFDSIYMHLAAAFNKTLFSIWGSSSPLFGEYPYHAKFTIFENNKISCRPCSRSGFNHCPKGHFKCMQDVTFDFYLPD